MRSRIPIISFILLLLSGVFSIVTMLPGSLRFLLLPAVVGVICSWQILDHKHAEFIRPFLHISIYVLLQMDISVFSAWIGGRQRIIYRSLEGMHDTRLLAFRLQTNDCFVLHFDLKFLQMPHILLSM